MVAKRIQQVHVLGPILDAQTLADENAHRRNPRSFHASGIEDCGRQMWYGLKGFKSAPKMDHPEWTRNAESGNALHEQYQKRLLRAGVVIPTEQLLDFAGWSRNDFPKPDDLPEYALEVPLPPNPYLIGGRIDAVVQHKDQLLVVDLKTVKQEHFEKLPRHYKVKKYKAQLQVYMHFTGIKYAVVVCINRSNDDIKEYVITYDPDWCETALKRIASLKRMLDDNILPPAEESYMGCQFCPFNELCSLNVGLE